MDGDGKITDEEFESTYKHAEGVDPIYKHDKHVIDADGNGEISRIELMVSESETKEFINLFREVSERLAVSSLTRYLGFLYLLSIHTLLTSRCAKEIQSVQEKLL